jgi:hypothetical protein
MKKYGFKLFSPLLLLALLSVAQAPILPAGKLEYVVTNSQSAKNRNDTRLFDAVRYTIWQEPADYKGQKVIKFYKNDITRDGYTVKSEFLLDPRDGSVITSQKVILNKKGEVISQDYDYYKDSVFNFGPRTFHFFALQMVPAFLDLKPGAVIQCSFLSQAEQPPMEMVFKVEGEETVTTPAGKFDCYKVLMTIDPDAMERRWGGAAIILRVLVPSFYLWVDKASPHVMVKFQGKVGMGVNAGDQVHKLVKR